MLNAGETVMNKTDKSLSSRRSQLNVLSCIPCVCFFLISNKQIWLAQSWLMNNLHMADMVSP